MSPFRRLSRPSRWSSLAWNSCLRAARSTCASNLAWSLSRIEMSSACTSPAASSRWTEAQAASAIARRPIRTLRAIVSTRRRSERPLHLFEVEALDDVAGLDVLESLEGHAALLAGLDLVDLVLEALERLQHAELEDHHVLADDPHPRALAHHSVGDAPARDL